LKDKDPVTVARLWGLFFWR